MLYLWNFNKLLFFFNLLLNLFLFYMSAATFPIPLTPDYGGPVVRYADGVFDLRLDRYITVREGLSLLAGCAYVITT